jgi:hypothetical protein
MTMSSVLGQYFGRSGGQGTSASARQPKDAVPRDEIVRVPQDFINGKEVTSIDYWAGYKAVLGWRKALN